MRFIIRKLEKLFDSLWRLPGCKAVGRFFYWIRTHLIPSDRYHIINIQNFNKDMYKWGWIDSDKKILLACMKIFCDFMEGEYLTGFIAWDGAEFEHSGFREDEMEEFLKYRKEHVDRHNSMKLLYNWWKVERPANHKLEEEILDVAFGDIDIFEDAIEVPGGTQINPKIWECSEEVELIRDLHRLLEEALMEQDNQMLKLLIDIRYCLWT